jgi:hexokinase
MLYTAWDGTQETAQAALSLVQSGGDQTGQAAAVIEEVKNAKSYDQQMERMGKTIEILFQHYTGEDYPDFKKRMKANVRRCKTTGVGYTE